MNLENKQKKKVNSKQGVGRETALEYKIPDKWEIKKLGEVVDFWNGKGHEKDISKNGKYIVVNSKFISSDGVVKKFSNKQKAPLKKEDITMVMSDVPNGKAIAKTFLIDEDKKYTLNQRIGGFKSDKIQSRFLQNLLNRNRYFLSFDDGVSQTNLRKDDILACKLIFPPLPEQKRIVGVLEVWDEGIEKLGRKIEINEDIKKGLMQQLLTGKKRLPGFSGEWDVRKLSDFKDLNHGDGDWILSENISQNGKYNIVQLGNIGFGKYVDKKLKTVSEDAFKKINGTILENGDLLINRMVDGNLNLCLFENIGDYITSVDVCWIRKNDFFDNYFLMHVMMLDYNQNKLLVLSSGSGRVRISKKNLFNKFEFKLPTLKEQKAIAEVLTTADEEIEMLRKKLEILKEQKRFLLNNLITGNIIVNY